MKPCCPPLRRCPALRRCPLLRRGLLPIAAVVCVALAIAPYPAAAQDGKPAVQGRPPGGKPGGGPPASPPGAPGSDAPKPDGQQPDGQKPEGEAGKPAETPGNPLVTRPAKPEKPADPTELAVQPDAQGKLEFNFHGQPWREVLEWLARVSHQSLDWQELPGDYLNLRTQRAYTVDEVRDLLNGHLLARGFTLLRQGEVLTVANLKKLDLALVPKVDPAELADRDAHEFVQTTFPLEWLPAATAEEELKPLLSPHGKLTKLTATNRLHAVDAVVNLRAIRELLAEEQSGRGQERLVQSFKLQHARAEDVKTSLEEFLGIEKKGGPAAPMDPNQARMMQQMAMQQAQQGGQPPGGDKKKAEVSIIANPRENSIIAQAPPEQMQVIVQTVKLLDVASDPDDGLLRNMSRMQVYRLASLDPEPLVELLNDMGDLDPMTRVTADKKNKGILVFGPLVDHLTVRAVIDKLDGSDRSFEVVRLRRLPADYVAGTIRFMMGGEEEKKKDNNSRRFYYFDPYGSQNDEKDESKGKFRVDADVENNRLLMWANPIELEEVNKLLVKLGEIRPEGGGTTVRVLDLSGERADEFLRRLQENWNADGTHPLVIEPAEPEPAGDPFAKPTTSSAPVRPDVQPPAGVALLAVDDAPPPDPFARPPAREKPATPITITRNGNGQLVIRSNDPQALDAVEDLALELAPPPADYHIFKLKYPTTWAYGVVINLEDFFGVDAKSDADDAFRAGWFGYSPPSSSDEGPATLGRRKPLKFISDIDSRTILVQGATPSQLRTIGDLIEIYDRPPSQMSGDLRITRLFKVKHAQAETIATAIKDVYRDLLSSSDRALQNGNQNNQQQQPTAERSYTYVIGGGGDKDQPDAPIKFKGLLSIGIDADSNTLVISASQGLMGDIEELITALDTASKEKEGVGVVNMGGGGMGGGGSVPRAMSNRLKEIFGDKVKIVGEEN